mmetsp:Transcript_2431/g.5202  ORF Transcript_2431/g.5202 Transcript_2431/m.5202 type:complete len:82 (+) Transcript_2431:145-390(+)
MRRMRVDNDFCRVLILYSLSLYSPGFFLANKLPHRKSQHLECTVLCLWLFVASSSFRDPESVRHTKDPPHGTIPSAPSRGS